MNSKFNLSQHVIVIEVAENGLPRLRNITGKACGKEKIGLLPTALEHHGRDKPLGSEDPGENGDPGHVYLLAGAGHYKIGKSKNAKSRYRNLSILMPFEISLERYIRTNTMKNLEGYWHYRFDDIRLNGE